MTVRQQYDTVKRDMSSLLVKCSVKLPGKCYVCNSMHLT